MMAHEFHKTRVRSLQGLGRGPRARQADLHVPRLREPVRGGLGETSRGASVTPAERVAIREAIAKLEEALAQDEPTPAPGRCVYTLFRDGRPYCDHPGDCEAFT